MTLRLFPSFSHELVIKLYHVYHWWRSVYLIYLSPSFLLFLPSLFYFLSFFLEEKEKKNDNRRKNTQFTETLFNLRGKTRKMMDNLNS
jgi:hypothetical protein